eukprot:11706410-Alexandrium_andersonii.AAC.1
MHHEIPSRTQASAAGGWSRGKRDREGKAEGQDGPQPPNPTVRAIGKECAHAQSCLFCSAMPRPALAEHARAQWSHALHLIGTVPRNPHVCTGPMA